MRYVNDWKQFNENHQEESLNEGLMSWVKENIFRKKKKKNFNDEEFIKELVKRLKTVDDAKELGINLGKFGLKVLGTSFPSLSKDILNKVDKTLDSLKKK